MLKRSSLVAGVAFTVIAGSTLLTVAGVGHSHGGAAGGATSPAVMTSDSTGGVDPRQYFDDDDFSQQVDQDRGEEESDEY